MNATQQNMDNSVLSTNMSFSQPGNQSVIQQHSS